MGSRVSKIIPELPKMSNSQPFFRVSWLFLYTEGMHKEKTLLISGIVIIALPHLGFPNLTEKIIFLILGLGVIAIAYAYFFHKTKKPVKAPRTPKQKASTVVAAEDVVVETPRPQTKEEITGFTFIKRTGEGSEDSNAVS